MARIAGSTAETGMARIVAVVDHDLMEAVDAEAAEMRSTRSAVVRRILARWADQRRTENVVTP
jgi:metal-responsive CopG/Arc/MetJ family transcriptional regulator